MITLSADFINHVNAKDTRKLIVAHLYYNESNYLPIATVATVIDSVQYYGVLKDMSGASQKWNIEDKNNVTINTPKLTLIDYNTPNSFSLTTEFASHSYYGRKLKVYYGYEGQTLSNMLLTFDGFIDDINYNNSNIVITGKNFAFPNVNLNGRRIDYDNQKIGTTSVPAGYVIHKENHNKYLPIPFGKHWCAPLQPGYYSETTKETSYCIYDEDYSSLLTSDIRVTSDIRQFNIGEQTSCVFLMNEDAYIPLHQQDWYGQNDDVYTIRYNSNTFLNGISIGGLGTNQHRRNDEKIFVTVPLRYYPRTDLSNWFWTQNCTPDSEALISGIFNNVDGTVFNLTFDDEVVVKMLVKVTLDQEKNLRADENSYVRSGRNICIPSTSSNNGGQGYLLGKWYIDGGNPNYTYPFRMYHWKNNYIPNSFDTGTTDTRFIGGGNLSISDEGGYEGTAYGARVFNDDISMGWNYDIYDEDLADLGLQGTQLLKDDGSQGLDPFILRTTLVEPVGGHFRILKNSNSGYPASGEINIYKCFHMTAGEVDLAQADRIFATCSGIELAASNSLMSTPQNANSYVLKRPYEYIEFLLAEKTSGINFSSDFTYSGISAKWEDFFSSNRDGSGFVIDEEMSLDKFIADYVSNEPFTVFTTEDGTYHFKILKKTYTTDDKDGTVDYNDATEFNISLTDSKNIYAEIKSLKTDYMYDLDSYVLDVNWRIVSGIYDYSFWNYSNTITNNQFKIDSIEKKYTSYTPVDTVVYTYNGKHYGCVKTHYYDGSDMGNAPGGNNNAWKELNEPIATSPWTNPGMYYGEDAEQYEIASWFLNMWANRHRVVEFSTNNLEYLKYTVGDLVEFSNVPFTLVGMNIKGFNGATNFTSTINGQTVYGLFIITQIQKSLKEVSLTAMQLHNLTSYEVERVN